MIHRTGLYITKLIFAVFLAVLVITATAFGETNLDVEIKEANNMNDDMVLAADYLTDRIKSACEERPEIISLQIDLGLFYTYRVQGVTERGTVMLIYAEKGDEHRNNERPMTLNHLPSCWHVRAPKERKDFPNSQSDQQQSRQSLFVPMPVFTLHEPSFQHPRDYPRNSDRLQNHTRQRQGNQPLRWKRR